MNCNHNITAVLWHLLGTRVRVGGGGGEGYSIKSY